jgi:hypothetical protein
MFEKYGLDLLVPLKADVEIGPNWGNLCKVENGLVEFKKESLTVQEYVSRVYKQKTSPSHDL